MEFENLTFPPCRRECTVQDLRDWMRLASAFIPDPDDPDFVGLANAQCDIGWIGNEPRPPAGEIVALNVLADRLPDAEDWLVVALAHLSMQRCIREQVTADLRAGTFKASDLLAEAIQTGADDGTQTEDR